MVFAMPKLEHPIFRDGPVPVGRGTIQADAGGVQVIHPQHVLMERPLKASVSTSGSPHMRDSRC
jgi:hypothetical protein